MPRPDLAAIGVKYRRVPVLSIGRDIYCDSALILEKLEQFYPGSNMNGKTGTDKALIKLLQKWTDLEVFARACECIPADFAVMKEPTFLKDREELWGREWSKERQTRMRGEALQTMKDNFEFLETMMSDDGRKWILESDGPSLADINGELSLPHFSSCCAPSRICPDPLLTGASYVGIRLAFRDDSRRIAGGSFFGQELSQDICVAGEIPGSFGRCQNKTWPASCD